MTVPHDLIAPWLALRIIRDNPGVGADELVDRVIEDRTHPLCLFAHRMREFEKDGYIRVDRTDGTARYTIPPGMEDIIEAKVQAEIAILNFLWMPKKVRE